MKQVISETELRSDSRRIVGAQSFDNQWLPESLLPRKSGGSQRSAFDRQDYVRKDFYLSLLLGDKLVVNRAFFVNDASFSKLIRSERNGLRDCFQNGWIVPFLFNEASLVDIQSAFATDADRVREWKNFAGELDAWTATKFDPNSKEKNLEYVHDALAQPFHQFCLQAAGGNSLKYQGSLGLDQDTMGRLDALLREMTLLALKHKKETGQFITREQVYLAFICAPGTTPDQNILRPAPEHLALKQLVDLAYSRNLTDAYKADFISGAESPDRSALQERSASGAARNFDRAMDTLEGLFVDAEVQAFRIPLLDHANLTHITSLRESQEGQALRTAYIDSLLNWRALAAEYAVNEQKLAESRQEPVHCLANVLRHLGELVAPGESARTHRHALLVSYALQIGGVTLGHFTATGGFIFRQAGEALLAGVQLAQAKTQFRLEARYSAQVETAIGKATARGEHLIHQELLDEWEFDFEPEDTQRLLKYCESRRADGSTSTLDGPTSEPPKGKTS